MATTDTNLQQLVINVGTEEKINEAIAQGLITDDMLCLTTDDNSSYLASFAEAGRGIRFSGGNPEDFSIAGTPTISQTYVLSNISASNYVKKTLDIYNYVKGEANILIRPTTLQSGNIFWSSNVNLHLCINAAGKLALYEPISGAWTDGTVTHANNTKLWVKLIKNGDVFTVYSLNDNNYTLDTLPDISNWTQDLTKTVSIDPFSQHDIYLGVNSVWTSQYFIGEIYLSGCNILLNNVEIWRAITDNPKTVISSTVLGPVITYWEDD